MRVVFLTTFLTRYRIPFHEGVRGRLAAAGIQYDLIYGQPSERDAVKGDYGNIVWGKQIVNRYIHIARSTAVWQPALRDIWNSDLAVLGQENRLLVNYVAQSLRGFRRSKLALWGHGRNFQAESGAALAERWKRFWLTRCDWWFGYTEQTRKIVESCGFPRERITVLHNAVDTSEISRLSDQIDDAKLAELRQKLGIGSGPVAVYLGGIYEYKRIDFLLAAALEVRRRIPDFVLVVVGSGTHRHLVEAAASNHPWIRYLGPRFGREKVEILRLGRVFVMPGLVGLAILDCAAAGLPMVTTAYPYHSPEIAYLQQNRNGLIVDEWRDPLAYADAVVSVLRDDRMQARLAGGAKEVGKRYTIERMAQCFSEGAIAALRASKR